MSSPGARCFAAERLREHLLEDEDAARPLIGRAGRERDRRGDAERLGLGRRRRGDLALAEEIEEVLVDAVRVDRAVLRILREHLADELVERRRDARVQRLERARGLVHVLDEERGDVGRVERQLAAQHLEEDDAERVDVARAARVVAEDALGRHVLRRSEELALSGEPRVLAALGDAEVEQLHEVGAVVAAAEEDVLRLEVAVDDLEVVRARDAAGDLDHHVDRAIDLEPAALRRRPRATRRAAAP